MLLRLLWRRMRSNLHRAGVNSGDPISKEDVELAGMFCVPIRNKDQSLPIWTEHGKGIKPRMKGDSLRSRPVHIDKGKIESSALGLMEVR